MNNLIICDNNKIYEYKLFSAYKLLNEIIRLINKDPLFSSDKKPSLIINQKTIKKLLEIKDSKELSLESYKLVQNLIGN